MKNKKCCTQMMENGGSILGQGISGISVDLHPRHSLTYANKRKEYGRNTPHLGWSSSQISKRNKSATDNSRKPSLQRPLKTLQQRKLILHFDVRNTVLVADSVTQIGVEQALNSYLTGVTWGYEKDNEWNWVSKEPSLTAPQPGCITYYKYLEKKLVKIPSDRGMLRRCTGDFTQEEYGQNFREIFEEALQAFEWTDGQRDPLLTMMGQNGKLYHYILPSVFHLIQHLHKTNRDFAIIVRTYGEDAPNVLKAIDHSLQGHHKDFRHLPAVKVNLQPGHIHRPGTADIEMEITQEGKQHCYTDEKEMYKFLSEQRGINAFVDDFLFWQNNSYSSKCGKPFWVDTSDTSVQHIIFDDNIRLTDDDSIVDLRLRNGDESEFSSVPLQDTAQYENMCLVQADLLESTKHTDYFVNKVKVCEDKYTRFLQNQASS